MTPRMSDVGDGDLELPPPPPEAVIMSPRTKRRAPPPPTPGSRIVMENLEVRETGALEEAGYTLEYDEPASPGSASVSFPPLPETPKTKVILSSQLLENRR